MKSTVITAAFLFWAVVSAGQTVTRAKGESPMHFVSRFSPDSAILTYRVIDTTWNGLPVILAFFDQPFHEQDQDYRRIIGTIFLRVDRTSYRKVSTDTIWPEGGDPNIEAVFFANADKDSLQELVILTSWDQEHYDFGGTLYQTAIYDHISDAHQRKLVFLTKISAQLDGGCDCSWRDGKRRKAKYKTQTDVLKGLADLGFSQ